METYCFIGFLFPGVACTYCHKDVSFAYLKINKEIMHQIFYTTKKQIKTRQALNQIVSYKKSCIYRCMYAAIPRLHLTPALPTAWLIRLVKYRPRRTVSAPSPLHFIIMPLSQLNTMPSIVCSTRLSPERSVEMSPHDISYFEFHTLK